MLLLTSGGYAALSSVGYSPWWETSDAGYRDGAFSDQAALLDEVVYFGEFRFAVDGDVVFFDGTAEVPIVVPDGEGGYELYTHWAVNYMTDDESAGCRFGD